MVFLTSILIVCILYFLQADGLIYVTVIAVFAELLNIFMTQTLTKSVEKKLNTKWGRIAENHKKQLASQSSTIKALEKVQETSIRKLSAANQKIKTYEEKIISLGGLIEPEKPAPVEKTPETPPEENQDFDLPCGSDAFKRRI